MDMNILHEQLFDMLMMFDELCRKHGIRYYLDSGCAIGAVREHDFIPWDDDIDVAIMRKDYIKLREILKNELSPNYKLIEPQDYEPYFFDMIPKLIDMNIPLRKETDEDKAYKNYQNRMSIDFFILDSVPDSKFIQKLIKLKCKLFYGMARSKRYKRENNKMTVFEKIASGVCAFLGRFFDLKQLLDFYLQNTMKYSEIESNTLIRSNEILYFIDFYKKDLYSDVVYLDFHGVKMPLPSGYDEILTKMYGDYMTPAKNYKGYFSHVQNE